MGKWVIWGRNPVLEALRAGRPLEKIFIAHDSKIPKAILKPLRLKKLMTGPAIVPLIHAVVFTKTPEDPNFSSIIWSVCFWAICLSVGCDSCTNIRPMLQAITTIPSIRKVTCQ